MEKALLPEEITPKVERILAAGKTANYTKPDLCLQINLHGRTVYETIELKSTKKDDIPGSSVQQVSPEGWVIFVKRSKKTVQVATGKYLHMVNSKLQFPDRSPRPQVSFSELQTWNQSHRNKQENSLILRWDEENPDKQELLTDWQGVLARRWVKVLFDEKPLKRRDPWFHNALRKFALAFLEEYDRLSPEEQQAYREFIAARIK